MATILGIQKSFSSGEYLVSLEDSGTVSTVVIKGDPQALALGVNLIITPPSLSYMLQEDSSFLLLESNDKIIL